MSGKAQRLSALLLRSKGGAGAWVGSKVGTTLDMNGIVGTVLARSWMNDWEILGPHFWIYKIRAAVCLSRPCPSQLLQIVNNSYGKEIPESMDNSTEYAQCTKNTWVLHLGLKCVLCHIFISDNWQVQSSKVPSKQKRQPRVPAFRSLTI